MRPVSLFRLSRPDVRAVRVALAAGVAASLVVIAACTDYGEKSVTGPLTGQRNSSSSSGGLVNSAHVDLCVDKSSPVGDYTFTYSDQNNQQALPGNRFLDTGFWTDEGGDFHAFPPFGNTGPTNLPDGSTTVFAPANVIHNDGITTACLRPLDRTQASLAYRTGQAPLDSYSGITIAYTSNNANAVYSHTDCLLDQGVLIPEHTIANPLSIPLWSAATVFAAGDLTRTDDFPATPNHGDRIWRAKVGNTNVAPPEAATWSTADLGPCDSGGNPTRAFANVVHGTVVTFVFTAGTTTNGQIAPTQTSCEDYSKETSSDLAQISAGFKGTKIHNLQPGVFFYYATVTKGAGESVGITQTVSPNAGGLPKYTVHQGQAYLYTFNGSSCTKVATLPTTNNATTVLGGTSLGAGTYVVGIKFNTDAPAGTVVPNAALTSTGSLLSTHNFESTVNGGAVGTTTASIDTKAK